VTPEEYAAAAAVIAAATAVFVQKVAEYFMQPLLSLTGWVNMLEFMYPFVEQKRRESAELARTFYDSQRAEVYPELPRHDVLLESYSFETFVKDMEPARKGMQAQESNQAAVTRLTMLAVRDVETAGRRQIIKAVETDQPVEEIVKRGRIQLTEDELREFRQLAGLEKIERQTWGGQTILENLTVQREVFEPVQGWARVATGRETCAWCLMLVSRGPVYDNAASAGLQPGGLEDEDVVDMFEADQENYFDDLTPHMDEWHVGCDCKIVPVFDKKNWVGKDEAKKALKYWNKASKRAKKELLANPDKQYYSRKDGEWQDTDLNREAINQLRQMIDAGEISTDWAAISLTSSPLAA
jgi:hypothetical protein